MAGSICFGKDNKVKFLKEESDTKKMASAAVTIAVSLGLSTSNSSIIRAIGLGGMVVGGIDMYNGYHGK